MFKTSALFLILPVSIFAMEPIELVDCPTPGLLESGGYEISMRMQPDGGILGGLSIGFLNRMLFGFYYGGTELIGRGIPEANPQVGFGAKLRLLEEDIYTPAFALGFNSQGYEKYFDGDERYRIKSKGFYGVIGKNYGILGRLGLYGGINYSLERKDEDNLTIFVGMDKTVNPEFILLGDFDLALNDDKKDGKFGEGKGYLNLGIKWIFAEKLSLEFDFKNLTGNGVGDDGKVSRIFKICFVDYL